jgi:hypothetical protein
MGKHVFLALSRPSDGREKEFHAWYDAYHLSDVVKHSPGFVSGQRYYAENEADGAEGQPSLALYFLDSDDLEALHRDAAESVSHYTPSNGVFAPDHAAWVYSAKLEQEAELERWISQDERSAVTLLFFQNAEDAPPTPVLCGGDASPLLFRASHQRNGEWPKWPSLMLVHGTVETSAISAAVSVWTYHPRGVRVTTAL